MNKVLAVVGIVLVCIVGFVVAYLCAWAAIVGFKAVWPDHFIEFKYSYCLETKKIIKADPVFEDNGKYEDEAYRVTYEDGSIGLVDNAQMKSGEVCVKTIDLYEEDGIAQGLRKESDL